MGQYNSYKDSGFDWIGKIPSHWGLLKSKYLWRESFSVSQTGKEDLLSVSQYDIDFVPLKMIRKIPTTPWKSEKSGELQT